MSFHRRRILLLPSAVAVAIVVASVLVYVIVRAELRGNVDSELRSQSSGVFTVEARNPASGKAQPPLPPPGADVTFGVWGATPAKGPQVRQVGRRVVLPHSPLGGPALYAQFVTTGGNVVAPPGAKIPLQDTAAVRAVAAGKHTPFFRD